MSIESFPQFWIYGGALLLFLLLIVGREIFHVWQSRYHALHRVPHLFNISILLLLILATSYGMQRLEAHRKRFETTFLPYPMSHYKAERQSFQFGDDWVYATDDTPETIIAFYKREAANGRYTLTVNNATSTARLLFQQDGEEFFLTIVSEGDERVLYYGKDGSIKRIAH